MARYLGPQNYGIYSYALAFIAFFSWISHLGLNEIIVRQLAKDPESKWKLLGSAFIMKIIGAVFSIIIIFITIGYIKSEDDLIKLVVLIVSIKYIFQSFDVIEYYYQSKVLSKYTVIAKNVAFVCSSLLSVYFILASYSVIYFAIANVVEILLSAIFITYIYQKGNQSVMSWRFDFSLAKDLLKFSWPLMVISFLVPIYLKIDQVMIGHYLRIEDVGIYSVAVKLAESWYFIPAIIISTVLPYFVKIREKDYELYQYRLVQIYFGMFWMGVLVGLVVQLFGERAVVMLFGQAYKDSFIPLSINIWAGIFVAQSYAKRMWVINENLQQYSIIFQLLSVAINISLNMIMIPMYGITGAALATIITLIVSNIFIALMIKVYRENTIISLKAINPFYVITCRNKYINNS